LNRSNTLTFIWGLVLCVAMRFQYGVISPHADFGR
jgi:hypothetical protein